MKRIFHLLTLVFVVFISMKDGVSAAETVSVKLSNFVGNKTTLSFKVDGEYVHNGIKFTSGEYSASLNTGKVVIKKGEANLWSGKDSSEVITLVPVASSNPSLTIYRDASKKQSNTYLGTMAFKNEGGYIRPINALDMEDYLKGVVPFEMSDSWGSPQYKGLEALKAQAVSARTFAKRHGTSITDTQSHQVYGGYYPSYEFSNRAVNETKGQTLKYAGKLAETYYSASNGGKVLSAKNVWNSSVTSYPYLTMKDDPYSKRANAHIGWTFSLQQKQIDLVGKDMKNPHQWWAQTVERDSVIINALKASLAPKGAEIKIIEIKTLQFMTGAIKADQELKGTIAFTYIERINGVYTMENGSIKIMQKSVVASHDRMRPYFGTGPQGFQNLRSPNVESVLFDGIKYVIKGNGLGHAIGMSQNGAFQMSKEGQGYKSILSYYYPGTTLDGIIVSSPPPPPPPPFNTFYAFLMDKEMTYASADTSSKTTVVIPKQLVKVLKKQGAFYQVELMGDVKAVHWIMPIRLAEYKKGGVSINGTKYAKPPLAERRIAKAVPTRLNEWISP